MSNQLLDTGRQWATTQRENDSASEAPLLHDDFMAVGPRGFVLDRGQWLARYEGGLHNDSFEWDDIAERRIGDCALLIGVQRQSSTYQGHPSNGQFRVTQVWLKGNGGSWRMASIHLSEIAQPG